MKKIILTILVSFLSLSAFAERYVMVTHGEGKDPFWPVVQKGGEDAASCLLYTSPSPRDLSTSRMPSSA